MIECLFVDRGDVFAPAFMLGVAFLALALFFQSSVETLFLRDIGSHLFMAVLAELGLCAFIEALMAFGAVFFPFGMALNDLPRHERCLNVFRPAWRVRERHEASGDSDDYEIKRAHRCNA